MVCFEGRPGAGKTYESIIKIADNLKLGRVVYTNLDGMDDDIVRESIKSFTGLGDYDLARQLVFIPPHKVTSFWEGAPRGVFFCIDEVHKIFKKQDWAKEHNSAFHVWASEHRKHGHDILLITQGIEKIDAQVRTLIDWTYNYKKVTSMGRVMTDRYQVFSWNDNEAKGKPLDSSVKKYNSRYYSMYNSYVSKDIKELGLMRHTNIFRHPIFFILPVFFLITIFFFSRSSIAKGDLFGVNTVSQKNKEMLENKKLVINEKRVSEVAPVSSAAAIPASLPAPILPSSPAAVVAGSPGAAYPSGLPPSFQPNPAVVVNPQQMPNAKAPIVEEKPIMVTPTGQKIFRSYLQVNGKVLIAD
ncbi:MAG: hypothetical protein HQL10_13475 [Nitrospirae bacterium]|nr:hypothetical protein [Nitrospirota bacterium]